MSYKCELDRHFNLGGHAARFVLGKGRRVADAEGVWACGGGQECYVL